MRDFYFRNYREILMILPNHKGTARLSTSRTYFCKALTKAANLKMMKGGFKNEN